MSRSESAMRGGQPSTTQPIAGPWLSPKVVTRKDCPNVLKDMVEQRAQKSCCESLDMSPDEVPCLNMLIDRRLWCFGSFAAAPVRRFLATVWLTRRARVW